MSFLSWLVPGNDRELAEARYAGRESATETAARKQRIRRSRSADRADRKGNAWADKQRRRYG
jgi:hypothetical protein